MHPSASIVLLFSFILLYFISFHFTLLFRIAIRPRAFRSGLQAFSLLSPLLSPPPRLHDPPLHPFQQRPCISKETLENLKPPPRCMASAFRRRTMQPTSPSIAKEARHVGFPLYRNGAEGTTISGKDASVPVISPAPLHNPNNPKYREPTPSEFQQARRSLCSLPFLLIHPQHHLGSDVLPALNAQTTVSFRSSYTLHKHPL